MRIVITLFCVFVLFGCKKQQPAEQVSRVEGQGPVVEAVKQPETEVADKRIPLEVEYPEPSDSYDPFYGVIGRYVRLYNHTNSRNLINQYTEVEVYGRLP